MSLGRTAAPLIEVCVDTVDGLLAAVEGGADRIEICSSLSDGGLTPSAGLIKRAAKISLPCYAMIRPRGGDFQYSEDELEIMCHDIDVVSQYGLAGVVFGAERADNKLNLEVLHRLMASSAGLGTTLHRVIDCVSDISEAIEQAIDLGFERVLTSGGATTAFEGRHVIAEMMQQAGGRIALMPGAGITSQNISQIAAETGATEFHASCQINQRQLANRGHLFADIPRRVTSSEAVRALKDSVTNGSEQSI